MSTSIAAPLFMVKSAAVSSIAEKSGSLTISGADDRRSAERLNKRIRAKLVGYRDPNDVTCETRDISEGGAYLEAPCDCGVSVGQRFEIVFESHPSLCGGSESGFATVVRTEHLRRSDQGTAIGVGLRFDQPLYL